MYLVAQYKLNDLIRREQDYEWKIDRIEQEILDLKDYSERLGDTDNGISNLFSTPASMYGRHLAFMQYSSIFANQQASSKMAELQQNPEYQEYMQRFANNPQGFQQVYQSQVNYYKQQAREQVAKVESRLLHEKEKRLSQRKLHMQQTLKTIQDQKKTMESYIEKDRQALFNGTGGGNG